MVYDQKLWSLRLVALWIFYAMILQEYREDFMENWDGLHDHS